VWEVHFRLAELPRLRSLPGLESLRVCCLHDGAGLPELGRAATALTRLTSLVADIYRSVVPTFPSGDLAFIGAALPQLRSLAVPLGRLPSWLPRLSALTHLDIGLRSSVSPRTLPLLAALPSLRVLSFGRWSTGVGGEDEEQAAACCPGVTQIVCSIERPSGLLSLQRALPGVRDAALYGARPRGGNARFIFRTGLDADDTGDAQTQDESSEEEDGEDGDEGEDDARNWALLGEGEPVAGSAPSPRWRGLRRLSLSGFPIGDDLQPLRRLGALDGDLLGLRTNTWLGGAQLGALLAGAPCLAALFVADLPLSIDWTGMPPHPELVFLSIGSRHTADRFHMGRPGLRDVLWLHSAFPRLQALALPDEPAEARWLRLLDAQAPAGGGEELPPAVAAALGSWRLDAARVAPAVRLVRAIRTASANNPQWRSAAIIRSVARSAADGQRRLQQAAQLYRMAEEGQLGWAHVEPQLEKLLTVPL
jgi:hypothetical protein